MALSINRVLISGNLVRDPEVRYESKSQKACARVTVALNRGRSASGEGYAWDVIRVIPPAIISGQAAGNAAVVALDSNCGIDKVDVAEVQKKQAEQNVMLHFDDALIPKDLAHAGEKGEDIGHF